MRLIGLFLLAVLVAVPGYAETTPWAKLDHSQIRLIAGHDDGGNILAGLEVRLDEGWKTYWRTAGDAGLPVSLDTAGSSNLKSAALLWPTPKRSIDFGSLETFVYKHAVTFPLRLEAEDPKKPIQLKLNAQYAVCKEICIFLKHNFDLTLSPGSKLSAAEAALLTKAEQSLSTPLEKQSDIALLHTALNSGESAIRIEATSQTGFEKPDVLIEGDANFRFPKIEVLLSDQNRRAIIKAPVQPMLDGKSIAGKELTFTLVDKERGVEWKTVPTPEEAYDVAHLLLMLLFAVVGGLILNIMPCVLPVLSLKILGMLKKSGKELKIVRYSFLASTAGIITSFLLLAAIVAGLQAAGKTIGWGFQFQEPYFLSFLLFVLLLFAANLFGLFEIRLPQVLNNLAIRVPHKSEEYVEHFLTGAFATLLATPCSAPFLGTAIGFAFSHGTAEIFTLFAAMGIGLSLPYLTFAAFPSLIRLMPKPGAWMITVKKFLGLLLLATAIWVAWLLTAQERHENQPPAAASALWQDFDTDKIKAHVNAQKVVLVDVTADWCLTCKANKALVLDTQEIVELLKMPNTVAMRADWTNRNEAIADYLKSFGRYGIPFNIVYGPAAPNGILLPELLNQDKVRKAIESARGDAFAGDNNPRPPELP